MMTISEQSDLLDKTRAEIFEQAHNLFQQSRTPALERACILELLGTIVAASESLPPTQERAHFLRDLTARLLSDHSLLILIRQQASELDALKRISRNLTSSLEVQQVLELVVYEAMHLLKNASNAHIFLYNDSVLSFGASLNREGERNKIFADPRPEGMTYTAAQKRQKIIIEDLSQNGIFTQASMQLTGSVISLPLIMDDRVVGVMNIARSQPGTFSGSDVRMLELLADQAAIAIVNARLHSVVATQAYTDILTSLPNRRALDERIEIEVQRARRYNGAFATVMMDLDGFKAINDTYGHAVGDMVLQRTFSAVAAALRASDFLARYGGDELTMILPESDFESALRVAKKLQEALRAIKIEMPDGKPMHCDLSGGIALFPANARTAADLLRAADEALYRAKRHQRGTFMAARGVTSPLNN
jgi:diguanylate cyclase (GGDEF)-like protein